MHTIPMVFLVQDDLVYYVCLGMLCLSGRLTCVSVCFKDEVQQKHMICYSHKVDGIN